MKKRTGGLGNRLYFVNEVLAENNVVVEKLIVSDRFTENSIFKIYASDYCEACRIFEKSEKIRKNYK